MSALGGELSLWRVTMRPGAPLAYGRLFGAPWLGLPGNPVSALVTFELFARPLLRMLAGHRRPHRRAIRVSLGEDVHLAAPLTHFLRAVLSTAADGATRASLTGPQSSGMLTSMAAADALVVVSGEQSTIAAGTMVVAIPLDADLMGGDGFPA